MNKNLLLNDTFDNISFNYTGICFENENLKKSSQVAIQKKENITNLKENTKVLGVSFDDSQFFAESFVIPSKYNTVASDSEDMFDDSETEQKPKCDLETNKSTVIESNRIIQESEDLFDACSFEENKILQNDEDNFNIDVGNNINIIKEENGSILISQSESWLFNCSDLEKQLEKPMEQSNTEALYTGNTDPQITQINVNKLSQKIKQNQDTNLIKSQLNGNSENKEAENRINESVKVRESEDSWLFNCSDLEKQIEKPMETYNVELIDTGNTVSSDDKITQITVGKISQQTKPVDKNRTVQLNINQEIVKEKLNTPIKLDRSLKLNKSVKVNECLKLETSQKTKPVDKNRTAQLNINQEIVKEKLNTPIKLDKSLKLNKSVKVNESLKVNVNIKMKEVDKIETNEQIIKSIKVTSKNKYSLENNNEEHKISTNNIKNTQSLDNQQQKTVCVNLERNGHIETLHQNEKLINSNELVDWGLPSAILEKYESRKVKNMFDWQVECLNSPHVLSANKNLVYSAPTSAGKTLVAEILAIKTVLERKKKVLFILPFVSVVREKMFYFQDILGTSGIRVEGYMGSYNPPGDFKSVQFAICTIEKANSLVNRMLAEGTLSDVGAVIVDEMHLLGDSSRGYLLELMLTKIQYMSKKDENVNIQMVGMSATLPNLNLLAKWLDAELYTTTFRPIPLYEQCHINGEIYNSNLKLARKIFPLPELENDTDNVLQLCLETIKESCSVLIFCPTKNWCENLAQQIAMAFWKLGSSQCDLGNMLKEQLNGEAISELIEQLKRCPVGLDKVLGRTVAFSVAFHHAGLTMDERDIIEGAFRLGTLRVLVATSTLSSGVNLPARRVIIRTPTFGGKPIDTLTYRQMIGRAGRMGKDTAGESILICKKTDSNTARDLMSANLQPVQSCLEGCGKLKRAILEVIASEVAATPDDVTLFTNCTLLAVDDTDDGEIKTCITDSLDFLVNNEFVRLQEVEGGTYKYVATSLAKACLSSSMPPEEGLALFAELEKARQCIALDTDLHLIYLVTPYSVCYQWHSLDWMQYLSMYEKLSANMKRVAELVGVRESYIVNATRGRLQTNTPKLLQKLLIHKRFYTALALQDLVNEIPLNEVANKFNCSRGMLQSLQQSSASFAGMVTSFSRQLGWSSIEILISQFQDRLQFGVSRDLLDLMRLPILNSIRARALYNAGFESLVQLAAADPYVLENILHRAKPFESEKERDGEGQFEAQKRNQIRSVWITGMQGITEKEAAFMLIQDARRFLQLEMGLAEAKWDNTINVEKEQLQESLHNSVVVEIKNQCVSTPKNVHVNKSVDTSSSSVSMSLELSPISSQKLKIETKNKNTSNTSSNKSLFENSDPSLFENSNDESLNNCITSLKLDKASFNKSSDILEGSSFFEQAFTSPFECNTQKPKNCKRMRDVKACEENLPIKKYKTDSQSQSYNIKIDEVEPVSLEKLEIIDVYKSTSLFESFTKEISDKLKISLSIGVVRWEENKPVIGSKKEQIIEKPKYCYQNRRVVGYSISWGGNTSYYVSLEDDTCVKSRYKINLLKNILKKSFINVCLFDSKEQIKVLKQCCDIEILGEVEDPKIADWLLEPEGKEKNLQAMALKYNPEAVGLSKIAGGCKGVGSVALDLNTNITSRIRTSVESVICWHITDSIKEVLYEQDERLLNIYNIEMMTVKILAKMEVTGIGISSNRLQNLADSLKEQTNCLEKKAYQLAGRRFSFTSSNDVAKVIGIYKGKKCSTNKQVLENNDNPISNLVLQWRKINSTLTKMVYPLLRLIQNNRIHGCCIMHNATGRISMHEPNLQNIPRDFEFENPVTQKTIVISCRSSFVPSKNNAIVSVDYCQLELRLLAHLSQDPTLCSIMKQGEDVFKSIAARWNCIKEAEVTDSLRQRAKQICYGIIYGMGQKTLSDQLGTTEEEAAEFMRSFHEKYNGIQKYINKTVINCRDLGYVETIYGRKRYLPHINHENSAIQKQAERQAVNTTVQGSAADIVKKATIFVENKMKEVFSDNKRRPKLVLQLHDELLYEVPIKQIQATANILKSCMEKSVQLSVPFPVKVKSGPSWGELTEFLF